MTWISQGDDVVTLINVFTVAPENQQRLRDLLVEATEAGAHMREAEKIATKIEPSLYEVSFVDEAPSC